MGSRRELVSSDKIIPGLVSATLLSLRSVIVLTDPGSIFYFGYLIAQWPAGLALQKLPVGKFLGITTIGKTQGLNLLGDIC